MIFIIKYWFILVINNELLFYNSTHLPFSRCTTQWSRPTLLAFIHVMGRDERWSCLGSVLYRVSISFLIIHGIISPNHPDPDDFMIKLRWALFVTYTIIQSITISEFNVVPASLTTRVLFDINFCCCRRWEPQCFPKPSSYTLLHIEHSSDTGLACHNVWALSQYCRK